MTRKMDSIEVTLLLQSLIDTPTWYGSTEEDNRSIRDIDVWSDIAIFALNMITSAYLSTEDAPSNNGSAIEMRDEVRGTLDVVREMLEDYDD